MNPFSFSLNPHTHTLTPLTHTLTPRTHTHTPSLSPLILGNNRLSFCPVLTPYCPPECKLDYLN